MRLASLIALVLALVLVGMYLLQGRDPAVPIHTTEGAPAGSDRLARQPVDEARADPSARTPATPTAARDTVDGASAPVRLVDAADGTPIAGLPYRVLAQGDAERVIAEGETRDDGRVATRDLPRAELILETLRYPPFAVSAHALDLRAERKKRVDLAVGRGGTIAGVVQDGDGVPLPDVEVFVTNGTISLGGPPPLPAGMEPAARSNGDGRFEVDAVVSRPRRCTVEEGALRAGYWEQVVVHARNPFDASRRPSVAYEHVEEGTRVELARPFVFELEHTVLHRGRVLDVDGRPAVDRFVTTRASDREELTGIPPLVLGQPPEILAGDFEFLEGEARTDALGRFEFERPFRERVAFWVVGPDGSAERFRKDVERGADGACEIGDVQLEFDRPIALRLLDEDGELVTAARLAAAAPDDREGTRYGRRGDGGDVTVWLHTADGVEEFEPGRAVVDGVVRLLTRVAPADVRSVRVVNDRFRPARVVTPKGMPSDEPLDVTLTPNRRVAVHLEADGNFDPAAELRLSVQLCTLSPERRAAYFRAREAPSVGDALQYCCRLGGARVLEWAGADTTVHLEAITDEPYWVHVLGESADATLPLVSAGPIRAGDTEVTVRVDAATLEPRSADPDAVDPSVKDQRSTVAFTLLDAETGEPTPEGRMSVPGDSPRDRPTIVRAIRRPDGRCHAVSFARGLLPVSVGATGYRTVDLGEHELRAGGTTDLGTVSLQPIGAFRARLIDSGGSPLPEGTTVRFSGHFTRTEADGLLTVHEDLPQAFVVAIESNDDDQRVVAVDGWSANEILELTVPPLRRVEVVVRGTDPLHTSVRAYLRLSVADLQLERFGDPATSWWSMPRTSTWVRSQTVRASGAWSFFSNMGVGSYTAELRSPFYDLQPIRFDVVEGEGVQVVELSVDCPYRDAHPVAAEQHVRARHERAARTQQVVRLGTGITAAARRPRPYGCASARPWPGRCRARARGRRWPSRRRGSSRRARTGRPRARAGSRPCGAWP